MAAATVLYVLNLGGNIDRAISATSAKLQKLQGVAKDVKSAVASMGSGARAGLNGLSDGAGAAAEGAGKAAAAFALLGAGMHVVLQSNAAYEQSTARLIIAAQKLGRQIADAIGPTVGKMIDSFTIGLTYIGTLVIESVVPAFETMGKVLSKFTSMVVAGGKIWFKVLTGDFSGAKETIEQQQQLLLGLVADVKTGYAEMGDARDKAFDAAFAAWRKQVDGIKDVVNEIKVKYQDIVSTIGGVRPGSWNQDNNGQFKESAVPQMGNVVTSSIGTRDVVEVPEMETEQKNTTSAVTGVLGAVQGGTTAMLAMAGPWGAAIAAIFEILSNIDGIVEGIQNSVTDMIVGLADRLDRVVTELAISLEKMLPKLVSSLVLLIPRLIVSIIKSAPAIFAEALRAAFALPGMIIEGFADLFRDLPREFAQAVGEAIKDIGTIFRGKEGRFLGTSLGAKAEEKRLFGIKVPFLDKGGHITQDGLAYVHKGEDVVPRGRSQGGSGGRANITINVYGTQDADAFVRQVQRKLGNYGVGLSLDPRSV